jgi:uncharacterized protein YjbI with pentapeptide repeats
MNEICLKNANMTNADVSSVERVDAFLLGANMTNTDLSFSIFDKSDFRNTNLI